MVTVNRDLLMAFVYFDQSHCGYLLEKDMEEILYTLGLHLSRAQVLCTTNKLSKSYRTGLSGINVIYLLQALLAYLISYFYAATSYLQ